MVLVAWSGFKLVTVPQSSTDSFFLQNAWLDLLLYVAPIGATVVWSWLYNFAKQPWDGNLNKVTWTMLWKSSAKVLFNVKRIFKGEQPDAGDWQFWWDTKKPG